jgi:uncharacterized membrane-anchored protein YhcB (DUF1043 family)
MSEGPRVGEPRPVYRTAQGDVEESVLERVQIQFPPYFERFLDERDQRLAAELRRLEAAIERNSQDIARVMREMDLRFAGVDRQFAEMRAEMAQAYQALRAEMAQAYQALRAEMAEGQQSLRAEMERRFTEVDRRFAEVDRRFAEMRAEIDHRFAEVERRIADLSEGQKALRAEVRSHFYWTMGLLFPLVISVVLMMIRLFFGGIP